MARKKKEKKVEELDTKGSVLLGASSQANFIVSSYTLNKIDGVVFPGNVSPEGYFYSPFHEISVKELENEVRYVDTKLINFDPETASLTVDSDVSSYDPETAAVSNKDLYRIKVVPPTNYGFIDGQPFSIYDVMTDLTFRGYLDRFTDTYLEILTETQIDEGDLRGGRYIISLLIDNAPEYAEYIPETQRLVWRQPMKLSSLPSTSQLYDMPFENGRLYIHKNINFYVRRQDPDGEYKLFRPSTKNPLRRFQIEGHKPIDFSQIKYITDTMLEPC